MLKCKRGQTGESITWIVATITLIIILIIFIYASVALAKVKFIKASAKGSEGSADWINSKTEIAYKLNPNNKNKIGAWISQAKEENKDE